MDNNGEMVISIEEACGSSPTVIEKGVNILWRLIIASVMSHLIRKHLFSKQIVLLSSFE